MSHTADRSVYVESTQFSNFHLFFGLSQQQFHEPFAHLKPPGVTSYHAHISYLFDDPHEPPTLHRGSPAGMMYFFTQLYTLSIWPQGLIDWRIIFTLVKVANRARA